MPRLTVVDAHHWISPDGGFPKAGPVRAKAVRVAQCIEYGGSLAPCEGRATLIPCRCRPQGAPCQGFLVVVKQPDDTILAVCSDCESEEFLISNWQDMPWAQGHVRGISVDEAPPFDETPDFLSGSAESDDDEIDEQLRAACKSMGWSISPQQLRKVISESTTPNDVFAYLQAHLPPPPSAQAIHQFLPVLMQAWNNTRRPDLGGLSPHDKAKQGPTRSEQGPSRNALCPCGSGKKYKRCCISKRGRN
jgi:hypothetical protein